MTHPTNQVKTDTVMSIAPTKHISFATPALLTEWRDKQPAGTEILDITYHDGKQLCYYRPPAPTDTDRGEVVRERILSHLNASPGEREALNYSKALLREPVAQYSLVRNSVRNLKCFRGLTPSEVTHALDTLIEELGFTIIESYTAKSLYGACSRLITKGGE